MVVSAFLVMASPMRWIEPLRIAAKHPNYKRNMIMNETTNANPPATQCSCSSPTQTTTTVVAQPQTQTAPQNPNTPGKGKRTNNRKK
jgi:hypothetical protein